MCGVRAKRGQTISLFTISAFALLILLPSLRFGTIIFALVLDYFFKVLFMKTQTILFLCTGNSCRSQMAEAWLRQLKPHIKGYSAGIEAQGLNLMAVKVMQEVGIDMSDQQSKRVAELPTQEFDYVITLCGHASETCPVFPGSVKRLHIGFDDPVALEKESDTEEEVLSHYRRVRDEIKVAIENVEEYLSRVQMI